MDQRAIDTMIDMLGDFEQELCAEIGDEMDKCEAYQIRHGIKRDVVPEECAPDLDNARSHIYDAIHALRGHDPDANNFEDDNDDS